ncbi:ImmA/IrrE family metallo-endopeptidase [Pedobacter sp. PWIIR3]
MNYIEEKAERLLLDLQMFTLPIEPEQCAKRLNVNVHSSQLDDDISGIFVAEDDVYYIIYNEFENIQRRRFTIAHELGHFLLHKNSKLFVDRKQNALYRNSNSSTGESIKEREANAFAAALLMPKSYIEDELAKLSIDDDIIEKLANNFNVSKMAMSFRLSNLGYEFW